MALLNNNDLEGKFNNGATGLFKTNATGDIGSDDARTLVEDLTDSFVNKIDDVYTSYTVTAGGTDTYTATTSPAIGSYTTSQRFSIKFTNANTGPATLNLNSLGAKDIKKSGTAALASGDIAAGQILLLIYDGTNFQVVGGGISSVGSVAWGAITGTLSSQTDLQTAIDAKAAVVETLASNTPSTAGGTITLDCESRKQLIAVGSASFSGSKTIALSNNTNAKVISFLFQLSGSGTLTMPSTFLMDTGESRWNSGTKVLTLTGAGYYEISATWDGTRWRVKASADGGYV